MVGWLVGWLVGGCEYRRSCLFCEFQRERERERVDVKVFLAPLSKKKKDVTVCV
jgi:hypothetical protein